MVKVQDVRDTIWVIVSGTTVGNLHEFWSIIIRICVDVAFDARMFINVKIISQNTGVSVGIKFNS